MRWPGLPGQFFKRGHTHFQPHPESLETRVNAGGIVFCPDGGTYTFAPVAFRAVFCLTLERSTTICTGTLLGIRDRTFSEPLFFG